MIRRYRAKPLPPKILLAIAILLVLVIVGAIISANSDGPTVDNFETCVEAGNPVAESYPEQCFHNGRGYTRQL